MYKCIINADDLGLRHTINISVENLIKKGLVTSATIMVKRDKKALEEALNLYKRYNSKVSFGLHLDLDEYFLFDETGHYGINESDIISNYNEIIKTKSKEIESDIVEQIKTLKKLGIRISHIDGHHFVHQFIEIVTLILPIAKQYGIKAMRINPDFYLSKENRSLVFNMLREYDVKFPGGFYDLGVFVQYNRKLKINGDRIVELMVHPEVNPPSDSIYRFDQYVYLTSHVNEIKSLKLINYWEVYRGS